MLGVLGLHGGDGGDEWLREREREGGGGRETKKIILCRYIILKCCIGK